MILKGKVKKGLGNANFWIKKVEEIYLLLLLNYLNLTNVLPSKDCIDDKSGGFPIT